MDILKIITTDFEILHGSLFIQLYFHRGRNCYALQIDKKTVGKYPVWNGVVLNHNTIGNNKYFAFFHERHNESIIDQVNKFLLKNDFTFQIVYDNNLYMNDISRRLVRNFNTGYYD